MLYVHECNDADVFGYFSKVGRYTELLEIPNGRAISARLLVPSSSTVFRMASSFSTVRAVMGGPPDYFRFGRT
jgi:hypothetical protein